MYGTNSHPWHCMGMSQNFKCGSESVHTNNFVNKLRMINTVNR